MATDVSLPTNLETLSKDADKLLSREEKIAFNQDMKGRFPGKLEFFKDQSFPATLKALYKFGAIDEDDASLLSCIAEKSSKKEQVQSVIDKCKTAKERNIIGREEDVKKVRSKLDNRHMVVPGVNLFGKSGVGKTTLAQEIAKTFEGFQRNTLDLRGIVDIRTVYSLILDAFELPAWDYDISRLNVHLESLDKKIVVVIDNVEQLLSRGDESPRNEFITLLENVVRSKACKNGKLKLLLTSRERISEPSLNRQFFSEHQVNPFTKEVSKDFISRRGKLRTDVSQESQDEALSGIAELCRDIPYLLQGAEQMVREGFCTPVDVLQKIKSQIEKGVPKEFACIGALFESISSDHLKQLAVKISLLQQSFSASTAMKIGELSSEHDAIIDLELLASHKIVKREKDEKDKVKYDIHGLFQDFVQDHLCGTHPSYKDASLQGEKQFFAHFSGKFTKLAGLLETDFVKTFSKLERNRANFELTIDISKRCSEACEILLHSDKHNEMALIGILLEVLKDWQERKKLYDEWAGVAEQAGKWLTSAHLRCWQTLQGPDMEGTHDAWEVLQIAGESLKKAEQMATPEQLRAGRSLFLHCRGRIRWLQASKLVVAKTKKEYKEHRTILKDGIIDLNKALEMRQEFMAKHTLNARTLNLIGNCYIELNDPDKAEGFYNRALNMKLELVGSDKHWEIPTYYNQMSQVHDRRGMKLDKSFLGLFYKRKAKVKYKKAVEWIEKALNLQEELDVADTEHTATFQRNLANALIGLGEYDQALIYATKCYENRVKCLGEHPETVRILYLTGVIQEWRKDIKAACESYKKAFEMEEVLPEHNHSIVREMPIRNRLKEMYSKLKLKDKRTELKRRIEAIEKEERGESPSPVQASEECTVYASPLAIRSPDQTTSEKSTVHTSPLAIRSPDQTTSEKSTVHTSPLAIRSPDQTTSEKSTVHTSALAIRSPDQTTSEKSTVYASPLAIRSPDQTTSEKSTVYASPLAIRSPDETACETSLVIINLCVTLQAFISVILRAYAAIILLLKFDRGCSLVQNERIVNVSQETAKFQDRTTEDGNLSKIRDSMGVSSMHGKGSNIHCFLAGIQTCMHFFGVVLEEYLQKDKSSIWVEYCGISFTLLCQSPEDIVFPLIELCKENGFRIEKYMKDWYDNEGAEKFFSQFPTECYQNLVEVLKMLGDSTEHILRPLQIGHGLVVRTKLGDVSSEIKGKIISILNAHINDLRFLVQELGFSKEELNRTQTDADIWSNWASSTLADLFNVLRKHGRKELAKELAEMITKYAEKIP